VFQLLLSTAAVAGALTAAPVPAADTVTFMIDKTHSELTFRIRHMMSRVSGTFGDWKGTISGDPAAWSGGSTEIVIQTTSIDTRNEKRDNHLRSADFFDAATYPEITFKSTSVVVAGNAVTLQGDLTMRGVTKAVTLTGEYLGSAGEGPGKQRVGFHVTGTINRMDYGVAYNRLLETGGVLLGDDVELDISIEAVRAP
jgi:polyisoprenoid-binding protein YceI